MALQKNGTSKLTGAPTAYHRVASVTFVKTTVTALVESFADKAAADANKMALDRTPYSFPYSGAALPGSVTDFAEGLLLGHQDFSGAQQVA